MIKFRKLGYVALNVTDIERALGFYTGIVDLNLTDTAKSGPVFLRCSRDHHNIVLAKAEKPGLHRVAFEVVDSDELDRAYNVLTGKGIRVTDVPPDELSRLNISRAFRIQDPNGFTLEFYSDIVEVPQGYAPKEIKIARLGHCVVYTNRFEESLKFYTETLGFKISDFIGQVVAFMRCHPNPYHHSFALVRSMEGKLNHVNFMVTDIDDIGRGRVRLIDHDVPIVFGPGRHLPSDSIFLYYLDPDGLTLEYSFGMEEFPETGARKPRRLAPSPRTLDMWGGKPTEAFMSKQAVVAISGAREAPSEQNNRDQPPEPRE